MQEIQEAQAQSLSQEDPLEKAMAIHSSILVWRIPWTEEPGGLQSMGLQRVGLNWVTDHTDTQTARLQASACSQWRHLAQIWGWSLGHLASKGPQVDGHLHRPGWRVSGPSWSHPVQLELDKTDSKFLENISANHFLHRLHAVQRTCKS